MAERSAPTIPRWCLTFFLDLFLATSSVIPFLLTRRKTTVHAIFRGFLRWRKRDSSLEVTNLCGGRGGNQRLVGRPRDAGERRGRRGGRTGRSWSRNGCRVFPGGGERKECKHVRRFRRVVESESVPFQGRSCNPRSYRFRPSYLTSLRRVVGWIVDRGSRGRVGGGREREK